MTTLNKAKKELRKHLLENRIKVKDDLNELRKKSEGDDYIKYISNLQNDTTRQKTISTK